MESQLAEPILSFVEGLKQVCQTAGFGQGLSLSQCRDSSQRRHSRRGLAGIHPFFP
ncbi:MAG: hypothetical protein ABIP82_05200 [Nitrospirales bacterium]